MLKENGTIKAAGVFYGYSSIFVILQSIGVFTLFGCAAGKTGAPRKEKSPGVFGKFVLEIDKCSFGIYLIHMIFVRGILKHTKIHPYGAGSPVYFDRPDPRHLPCLVHPNVDSEEDPRG